MDIDDFEEWSGKYNIGDMFVDSFGSDDIVSYIYRIEYEPNSKITYYWLRYFYNQKDLYITEEELDETLSAAETYMKHYPVKK
jgi:hypothetical protein